MSPEKSTKGYSENILQIRSFSILKSKYDVVMIITRTSIDGLRSYKWINGVLHISCAKTMPCTRIYQIQATFHIAGSYFTLIFISSL